MFKNTTLKGFDRCNVLLYSVVGIMVLSGLSGCLFGNRLDTIVFSYFDTEGSPLDSLLKYGRIALIIWIAGFFRFGIIIELLAVGFVSFAYGFSSSVVIMNFGFQMNILLPIFVQALILIPSYIFMTIAGVEYYAAKHNSIVGKIFAYKNFQRVDNKDYMLVLAIGMACSAVAVLLEMYVVPIMLLI